MHSAMHQGEFYVDILMTLWTKFKSTIVQVNSSVIKKTPPLYTYNIKCKYKYIYISSESSRNNKKHHHCI